MLTSKMKNKTEMESILLNKWPYAEKVKFKENKKNKGANTQEQ